MTATGTSVQKVRRRQACIAEALDELLGEFPGKDPNLWEHRAFLMIVGLIHERLTVNESELSNDELVQLAKVLAEQRRAIPKGAEAGGRLARGGLALADALTDGEDEVPANFAEIVRRVYGADLDRSSWPRDVASSEPVEAD